MLQQSQAISIRRAASEDAPQILACLRAAFEEYREFYTPGAFLDAVLTLESFQDRLAKMIVFAAVTDSGAVVATIACDLTSPEQGHLRGIAVLPSLRGEGIAAQLLRRAEAELHSRGATRVTLDSTAPLQRAMGFYEKFGYRRSGRVTEFFGMSLIEYDKTLASENTLCA